MWSAAIQKTPNDFTTVGKYSKGYVAIHTKGDKTTRISKQPETDKKIAEEAAKSFAKAKNIPYIIPLGQSQEKVVTVIEKDGNWFPAVLLPDRIALFMEKISTGSSQSKPEAIQKAMAIAAEEGGVFIESSDLPLGEELT